MSLTRVFGTLSVVFAFTFAGSALARPPGCEEQCLSPDDAELVCACWNRAGAPVITCGEYEETLCGWALESEEEESDAEAVSRASEAQVSEAPRAEVCWASR